MSFRHGMLAPLLAVLAVAVGLPLTYAIYLSATDYRLTDQGAPNIIGRENFAAAVVNGAFWESFATTALYIVLAVGLELILGLAIALSLQQQKWFRNGTRAFLLAPMFITPIAVGLTFRLLLNDQLGAIPAVLDKVGISYDFFGPGKALYTLILIDVWQWTPFMVLLLLAGLESIPKPPLEAAKVDGASAWYRFRRIILPLLSPILVVAILLRALDALKVFEYVFATTRGGPGTETQTLQYFMYQEGIQFFQLGSASAMALIVLLFVLALIVFTFRRIERSRS